MYTPEGLQKCMILILFYRRNIFEKNVLHRLQGKRPVRPSRDSPTTPTNNRPKSPMMRNEPIMFGWSADSVGFPNSCSVMNASQPIETDPVRKTSVRKAHERVAQRARAIGGGTTRTWSRKSRMRPKRRRRSMIDGKKMKRTGCEEERYTVGFGEADAGGVPF